MLKNCEKKLKNNWANIETRASVQIKFKRSCNPLEKILKKIENIAKKLKKIITYISESKWF